MGFEFWTLMSTWDRGLSLTYGNDRRQLYRSVLPPNVFTTGKQCTEHGRLVDGTGPRRTAAIRQPANRQVSDMSVTDATKLYSSPCSHTRRSQFLLKWS